MLYISSVQKGQFLNMFLSLNCILIKTSSKIFDFKFINNFFFKVATFFLLLLFPPELVDVYTVMCVLVSCVTFTVQYQCIIEFSLAACRTITDDVQTEFI